MYTFKHITKKYITICYFPRDFPQTRVVYLRYMTIRVNILYYKPTIYKYTDNHKGKKKEKKNITPLGYMILCMYIAFLSIYIFFIDYLLLKKRKSNFHADKKNFLLDT